MINPSGQTPNPTTSAPALLRHLFRRLKVRPTRFVLIVSVWQQRLLLLEEASSPGVRPYPAFIIRKSFRASTSRFGTGQEEGSRRTPLGLHRVARKIGGGCPIGTVFAGRKPVGFTWQGKPSAPIAHRILWLEGLEPGVNRGGTVDSYARYIYIHGAGDELTLGRPASQGCIHLAAADLLQLFDLVPTGTLVWIQSPGFTLPNGSTTCKVTPLKL
jgi:lipoprotein-anchoring transpeptidase ErfK/SrfK